MDDYTYAENLKLAAERDMFEQECLSCCIEDDIEDFETELSNLGV